MTARNNRSFVHLSAHAPWRCFSLLWSENIHNLKTTFRGIKPAPPNKGKTWCRMRLSVLAGEERRVFIYLFIFYLSWIWRVRALCLHAAAGDGQVALISDRLHHRDTRHIVLSLPNAHKRMQRQAAFGCCGQKPSTPRRWCQLSGCCFRPSHPLPPSTLHQWVWFQGRRVWVPMLNVHFYVAPVTGAPFRGRCFNPVPLERLWKGGRKWWGTNTSTCLEYQLSNTSS